MEGKKRRHYINNIDNIINKGANGRLKRRHIYNKQYRQYNKQYRQYNKQGCQWKVKKKTYKQYRHV